MAVLIVFIVLFLLWNIPNFTQEKPKHVIPPTKQEVDIAMKQLREETAKIVSTLKPVATEVIPDMPKKKNLVWFPVPDVQPSPAEELIAKELSKYRCKWVPEVAFDGFKSSKWGYYRFDFYLPAHNLVIEYDSKKYHSDPERIQVDAIKTAFCWDNGINIVRLTNKDYYVFPTVIEKLMKNHSIRKK